MESSLYLNPQQQEEQPQQEKEKQERIRKDLERNLKDTYTKVAGHHQRLIPLTTEIKRAMENFNRSHSSTGVPENLFYNTFSITSLVREEVHNILKELTNQYIGKKEFNDLIERRLKKKIEIVQDDSKAATTTPSTSDGNQAIEVTVEMPNESDKNKLIVENFQILEQRITKLEDRLSHLLQLIPKLRATPAENVKINTEPIREGLTECIIEEIKTPEIQQPEPKQKSTCDTLNPYDLLYYEQRMKSYNLLKYKQSITTMALNKHAVFNTAVKPFHPPTSVQKYKPKMRSMFISSNQ